MNNKYEVQKIVTIWSEYFNGQAFYIPTLGPIYTAGNFIEKVLSDILDNAEKDSFLNYDKEKRWFEKKNEQVELHEIKNFGDVLCVPVVNSFDKQKLKLFCYKKTALTDNDLRQISKIKDDICRKYKINDCTLFCLKEPGIDEKYECHPIFLKKITKEDSFDNDLGEIYDFENLAEQTKLTFSKLGNEIGLGGFRFLWKEHLVNNKKKLSPIKSAVYNDEIIGAIGHLDAWEDAWGSLFLLPPYFGVKKEHRGKGWGEKLWQAAMSFAYKKGAKYTLVQNTPDSPAAKFYEKQGLIKAGENFSMQI